MNLKINQRNIHLPDYVGRGYGTYWRWKGRYRVCKGSKSAAAIRERYAISTANIRASENVTFRYSYQNGLEAHVTFHGRKIPLYRYDGAPPQIQPGIKAAGSKYRSKGK